MRQIRYSRSQSGFILIVALCIMAIIATLAMQYSRLTRDGAERARMVSINLAGFYAADAGLERAKAALASHSGDTAVIGANAWCASNRMREVNGWKIRVEIIDEGGCININTADPLTLARYFGLFNMPKEKRDVLVSSILDWIDTNELQRLNGAESDWYLSLRPPHRSRNALMDSPEELTMVRGAPTDLLTRRTKFFDGDCGMLDGLSISGGEQININAAPAAVLLALEFRLDEARKILEARQKKPFTSLDQMTPLIGEARVSVLGAKLSVSSSSYRAVSSAYRSGADTITVWGRFRRKDDRLLMTGFHS